MEKKYYVEMRGVNKSFGSFQASKDIHFGIEKGKLIGLLGPSGSGKTTILRMLAGLETEDSGDILIDGNIVNHIPASKRGIGFVFQNYALFRYLTVYENIAFGLRVQKWPKAKIKARVEEMLQLVGLEETAKRYPNQLSGGQRQRIAFARALAPEPQLLLLDEPFAAVDAKVRQELRSWLREMITRVGVTSIFVTHDQDEAIEVADEIIITNRGHIEQKGSPVEVYQSPETLNECTIKAFLNRFTNVHPIFVDCNDSTSRKGAFTFGLRKELEKRNINYSITNVSSSIDQFAKAFQPSKQNVVILNTGRSPQLTAVLNKLDEFDSKYPGASISLFGYTEWLMYAKYNLERFYKYDTYIPSTFYYNPVAERTQNLEKAYEGWFHQPMMIAQPRFAITGYDHGMFFIQGIKKKGKEFTGERQQVNYQPVQTPLHFVKTTKGGYKNKNFQMIHYTFNHKIESVNY